MRNFTIYVSKSEVVYREVQRYFRRCTPARFTEKVLGAWSRFLHPKTKLFALRFRRIFEVLCVQDLQKKFWAHFHDLCVQKRSCLAWSSNVFWTLCACKVCRKSFGRNFTIYVSKNEAVFHEVQTYLESFSFARCMKMFSARLYDLCVQKQSCLTW